MLRLSCRKAIPRGSQPFWQTQSRTSKLVSYPQPPNYRIQMSRALRTLTSSNSFVTSGQQVRRGLDTCKEENSKERTRRSETDFDQTKDTANVDEFT